MNQKPQLTISEFSTLTGIKKDTLRYYDRIGLLSPETRGTNDYRYYSRHQLSMAYLISSLRSLNVGIDDIKQYSASRTPEKMMELFDRQEEYIRSEIESLQEMQEVMERYKEMTTEALAHPDHELLLIKKPAEPILLCPLPPQGATDEEIVNIAYEYAAQQKINIGYPSGAIVTRQNLESSKVFPLSRLYLKTRQRANAYKPAGLYAAIYTKGSLDQQEEAYQKLLTYIHTHPDHLQITGDAYEEYPLDEMSIQDTNQCQIHIEIPVTPIHSPK